MNEIEDQIQPVGARFTDFVGRLECVDEALLQESADKRRREMEKRERLRRIEQCRSNLIRLLGRYSEATFANFEATRDDQRKVKQRLQKCAIKIIEFVEGRTGLILYGTIGTGKDHLAISLLKAVVSEGISAEWHQAAELYTWLAASYSENTTQQQRFNQLFSPEVLCISDPVFKRNWTEPKADYLATIVRGRYDRGKATWITTNVSEVDQLKVRAYADVVDRLKENAVMEKCAWPSYRQDGKMEF